MKKWLLIVLIGILLVGCRTPEERSAINFLKDRAKAPSTFKVLEIESKNYTWQDSTVRYDTAFFYTKTNRRYYSWYYSSYDSRIKTGQRYDSIVVTKNWYEGSPATWVSIKYQANNLFNVPLKGHEIIVVRYGRPRFLIDDVGYTHKRTRNSKIILNRKFSEVQIYK